jgi:DNA-3-methyladenine glycosylase I
LDGENQSKLFEMLLLEGFQAGLSWITILKKREAFREAFEGFDPNVIAGWGDPEVERLLQNAGIIRHRGKIEELRSRDGWDAFRDAITVINAVPELQEG